MTTRDKKTTETPVGVPEIPPAQGIKILSKHRDAGAKLLSRRPLDKNDYSTWTMLSRNYLEKVFGKGSPNISSVTNVGRYGSFPMNAGEPWWEDHRAKSLSTQLHRLNGLVELLQTEIDLQQENAVKPRVEPSSHRIFLVHGRDERALHETARYLEKLRQDVVVLREQPNQGRTVVEKFEDYSDVGFAVVLLTGDDLVGSKSECQESLNPRARQNVIFELGFFNGRLGRSRTCALYESGVELPSDYDGVLYIELDERGAWRLQLAKELNLHYS